jgi:very-short-patch-repair endonuclease
MFSMRSSSHAHRRARSLRQSMSPREALLWTRLRLLRGEGPSFRRQHPIGPYVADFYCSAAKLVVEVDGAEHTELRQIAYDERRDAYMRRLGYRVLRAPAGDIFRRVDDVAQGIVEAALAPPPSRHASRADPPPPLRG